MSGKRVLQQVLEEVICIIKQYCIKNDEDFKRVALLLVSQVLDIDKTEVIINKSMQVNETSYKRIINAAKKYTLNYPFQYCTNKAYFMGMEFYVDENVLIPRADTETLIDVAINLFNGKKNLMFLDIGTGSGCIAISLAKYLDCKVLAVDISQDSLEVAVKNAKKNGIFERIEFLRSNLFENIPNNYKFNAIFSNPPYISEVEMDLLDKKVLKEPKIALFSPEDGYYYFEEIAQKAKNYLKESGYLIFEVGFSQAQKVKGILADLDYVNIESKNDLNGIERCIYAQLSQKMIGGVIG